MSARSEDDLVCDFAEYYHILNWRGLPLKLASTLAFGLPDDSRSKRRINGMKAPTNTILLANLVDQLNILLWWQTRDGQNGVNKPESIVQKLISKEPKRDFKVFTSKEDFMNAYNQAIEG